MVPVVWYKPNYQRDASISSGSVGWGRFIHESGAGHAAPIGDRTCSIPQPRASSGFRFPFV
jgi:hypothetical protein